MARFNRRSHRRCYRGSTWNFYNSHTIFRNLNRCLSRCRCQCPRYRIVKRQRIESHISLWYRCWNRGIHWYYRQTHSWNFNLVYCRCCCLLALILKLLTLHFNPVRCRAFHGLSFACTDLSHSLIVQDQ